MPASHTQRIGNCPTALQAVPDACVCEAGFAGPGCDALGATIVRQVTCATAVLGLLSGSGPAAVSGLVVSSVVDAVEGQVNGAFAHVREEVVEVTPPVADHNAATPVSSPFSVVGLCAPGPHRAPRRIGFCAGHPVGFLVPQFQHVAVEAAATSSIPPDDCVRPLGNDSATVALELPHGGAPLICGSSDGSEPPKLSPRMVVHFCHVGSYRAPGVM